MIAMLEPYSGADGAPSPPGAPREARRAALPRPYFPPPAARCTADLIALVMTLPMP
jgi:hypothetical protein